MTIGDTSSESLAVPDETGYLSSTTGPDDPCWHGVVRTSKTVYLYCFPILLMLGILFNSINSVLFRSSSTLRSSSFTVFITAAGVIDSLALVAQGPRCWLSLLYEALGLDPATSSSFETNDIVCKVFTYLAEATQAISLWMVVLLAAERTAAATQSPNRRPSRLRRPRIALQATIIVVVSGLVLSSHVFLSWQTSLPVSESMSTTNSSTEAGEEVALARRPRPNSSAAASSTGTDKDKGAESSRWQGIIIGRKEEEKKREKKFQPGVPFGRSHRNGKKSEKIFTEQSRAQLQNSHADKHRGQRFRMGQRSDGEVTNEIRSNALLSPMTPNTASNRIDDDDDDDNDDDTEVDIHRDTTTHHPMIMKTSEESIEKQTGPEIPPVFSPKPLPLDDYYYSDEYSMGFEDEGDRGTESDTIITAQDISRSELKDLSPFLHGDEIHKEAADHNSEGNERSDDLFSSKSSSVEGPPQHFIADQQSNLQPLTEEISEQANQTKDDHSFFQSLTRTLRETKQRAAMVAAAATPAALTGPQKSLCLKNTDAHHYHHHWQGVGHCQFVGRSTATLAVSMTIEAITKVVPCVLLSVLLVVTVVALRSWKVKQTRLTNDLTCRLVTERHVITMAVCVVTSQIFLSLPQSVTWLLSTYFRFFPIGPGRCNHLLLDGAGVIAELTFLLSFVVKFPLCFVSGHQILCI